jgi:hypothetical protein
MRFDVYGRYQLEIVRDGERWVLYRLDNGRRRPFTDFVVPGSLRPNEIATYLDDMLHEYAKPGDTIRQID